jgi:hypothetical protein
VALNKKEPVLPLLGLGWPPLKKERGNPSPGGTSPGPDEDRVIGPGRPGCGPLFGILSRASAAR